MVAVSLTKLLYYSILYFLEQQFKAGIIVLILHNKNSEIISK
jgi:hypothetical protein